MEIEVLREPTEDITSLLERTIWGTEGGTRYQHTGTRKKIANLHNPYFLQLKKGIRTLGTGNFCQRNFETQGHGISSYYIRYFSLFENFRSKSAPESPKRKGNSRIKTRLKELFEEGGFQGENSAIHYAYMELENARSLNITQGFGFQPARKFSTLLFSRFFPKEKLHVTRIQENEKEEIKKNLLTYYSDYAFYETNRLFFENHYYVFKKEGMIVGGVQAIPERWVIKEMSGWSGKILRPLAPYLPLLNRVFNPNNHRFLSLEHFFIFPEFKHLTSGFLETVLAQTQHRTAMIWADAESPLYTLFRREVRLGLLDKLNEEVPADIMVRFTNIPREKQKVFFEKPAYICAFDLT